MLPKVEKLMTPKALSDQTAHICTHMCLSVSQRNVDQKSLETVFKIAICRQYDDKWQNLETNGNQSLFFIYVLLMVLTFLISTHSTLVNVYVDLVVFTRIAGTS